MDKAVSSRKGDWMQTVTGRKFWPLDPNPDDICIEDIAHALSMLCRYGGHTLRFYSVAEHCCHVHDAAAPENKLWALMHDASEAYISDVIRPIKPFLTGYKATEKAVMSAVCTKFGMSEIEPEEVSILDKNILGDEAAQAMSEPPEKWYYKGDPLGITLQFWSPDIAKAQFLARFRSPLVADGSNQKWATLGEVI